MKKYEVQLMFFSNNGVGSSTHTIRSRIFKVNNMYDCINNTINSFKDSLHASTAYKIEICEVK